MSQMSQGLGDRLRLARKRALLSQEGLSERAEVSRKSIGRYENGAYEPDLPTLKRLASALGVGTAWLTDGTGEPDAPPPYRPLPLVVEGLEREPAPPYEAPEGTHLVVVTFGGRPVLAWDINEGAWVRLGPAPSVDFGVAGALSFAPASSAAVPASPRKSQAA